MKKERTIKTGDKSTDALYKAVVGYVKKRKGSVVVIGGIALVQEGPEKFKFGLMVRCVGKKPVFEESSNKQNN